MPVRPLRPPEHNHASFYNPISPSNCPKNCDADEWDDDSKFLGPDSSRSSKGPRIEKAEDLRFTDMKLLDQEKVTKYAARLRAAVEAEHEHELLLHLDKLKGGRDELIERKKLIVRLKVEDNDLSNSFRLTRTDGKRFTSIFKQGDFVTLFVDLLAPSSDEDDGKAGPSNESGAEDSCEGDNDDSEGAAGGSASDTSPLMERKGNSRLNPKQWDTALKQQLRARFRELGLHRMFDAVVVEVRGPELIVRTRNEDAEEVVAKLDDRKCAVMEALPDATYCIQKECIEALPNLVSVCKDPAHKDGLARSPEELRLRRLLLCDPAVPEDKAFATAASAEPVPWLDETARAGIEAVLAECGLNEEQRAALQEAARRSVTLIQGPPGTGKTRALGSMCAALLRVFHDPLGVKPGSFGLPSHMNMVDWSKEQVAEWIGGFPEEDLRQAAAAALEGFDGRRIVTNCAQPPTVHSWFAEAAASGGGSSAYASSSAGSPSKTSSSSSNNNKSPQVKDPQAKRYAEAFMAKRAAALELLDRHRQASGYGRTAGRDMRIFLCADSNTAANRMLESLTDALSLGNALGFDDAHSFEIVRMGVTQEGEEGFSQAKRYHIDNQREQHDLVKIKSRLDEAVRRRRVTAQLGAELQTAVNVWVKNKKLEAERCKRQLVQKKWHELAEEVEQEIKIEEVVSQYLSTLRARYVGEDGRMVLRDLKTLRKQRAEARRELHRLCRRLYLHTLADILIPVQVVVGTNTSLGEVRRLSEDYGLTFPIVIMDEAGQSTEQSSNIPLTLGAEWALLGGDLLQLPPTIKTEAAKAALGYKTETGGSQYGRLRALGVTELALHRQYRMHQAIREFPSEAFYGGSLEEDPHRMPDMRVPTPYVLENFWPTSGPSTAPYPIVFFDVAYGKEAQQRDETSWYNLDEAELALQLVLAMGSDPTVRSIAVLSPYRAQADLIAKRLEAANPVLEAMHGSGDFHATQRISHTVDGFQGHEADVVIITTVRSRVASEHVQDERRLNVAITRARRALLILGNYELLRQGGHYWARLLAHLLRAATGAVIRSGDVAHLHKHLPRLR